MHDFTGVYVGLVGGVGDGLSSVGSGLFIGKLLGIVLGVDEGKEALCRL